MVWLCAKCKKMIWYTDIRKQGNTKPQQNNLNKGRNLIARNGELL